MKKYCFVLLALCTIIACSDQENNLSITGQVKGLKEGTLYLQKLEDTTVVTIDSAVIQGDPNFAFETYIESPQVMFLNLEKLDRNIFEDRLTFFAEPGKMTVTTTLDNFGVDVYVTGSKNQEKLEEFQEISRKFNDQKLELVKKRVEAKKQGSDSLLSAVEQQSENLLKRKYLYTVNFAVNNKDTELAPYLALSEIYDANVKFLDTIYNSLTPKVKESTYGKDLKEFIQERKELEATLEEAE